MKRIFIVGEVLAACGAFAAMAAAPEPAPVDGAPDGAAVERDEQALRAGCPGGR